ncbi:DNA repair protein RecN [Alloprevotella tannerae]|uniref:DNA repair protein RecN n=1 Tax=Alloprevotella tannerae TaxID=76122 RepID=UPI0028E5C8EA|nr:DNA repair protein RecN [Alloprevotella tannerae]
MLTHLYISNYALIEELDIDFHNGFSVITGETGAGKSIILGALGLLLGKRADAQAIKNGEKKCSIEASFDIRALNLKSFFADNDIDNDDTECILRREVINTGKSRAFINDTPVSLTQLKELGTYLIDIHSQHQNLLMNQEDFLLDIVDTIAGNQSLRETYLHTFEAWKRAQTLLLELQARAEKDQANQDYLKFQIQQFQEANLSEGEQEELEQEASTLNHAEDIKQALFAACAPLVSEELRLLEELKNGVQKLESISAVYPQAQEMAERLNSAYIELEDLSSELEKVQMEIEFDPIRQNFVEERLNTIYSLEQKHKVSTIAELLQIYDDLQKRLNEIENIDETLKEKEKEVEQQLGALAKSAKALTKSRETAAKTIAKSLIEQLQTLGMPHVKLEFSLTPKSSFDRNGSDTISLLFSANKNRPLQDVAAIASGGEIARLMLSLKALIAKSKALPTIIFDEIDTGVSGTMAEKMALTMQQIADNCQVLCITHLPQIAALGAHHYRVYKVEGDDKTTSHISLLSQEERIKEIANMLTGSEMTEAAINNAKSLLRIN